MTIPVLDTHAWVGWLLGSPDLAATERAALDALPPDRRPYVSAISSIASWPSRSSAQISMTTFPKCFAERRNSYA